MKGKSENIDHRKKLVDKKWKPDFLKVHKRYKKVPRIKKRLEK